MTNDPLQEATRALREQYNGQSEHAAATEQAVLKRVRRASWSKLRWPALRKFWIAPLVTLAAATSAWAGGDRLRNTLRDISALKDIAAAWFADSAEPVRPPNPGANRIASHDGTVNEKGAELEANNPSARLDVNAMLADNDAGAELIPPPPVEVSAAPQPPRPVAHSKHGGPSTAPSPATSLADQLYRDAHHAHFVARDPSAALLAWDRYLATAPSGPLALEAQYNRALALYRLGRSADAEAALSPFADGEYGTYRQREARALLQQSRARGVPQPAPVEHTTPEIGR